MFVCSLVSGSNFSQGAICHMEPIILGGNLFWGAVALCGFLTKGLMIRSNLSGGFLPGTFDLEPENPGPKNAL